MDPHCTSVLSAGCRGNGPGSGFVWRCQPSSGALKNCPTPFYKQRSKSFQVLISGIKIAFALPSVFAPVLLLEARRSPRYFQLLQRNKMVIDVRMCSGSHKCYRDISLISLFSSGPVGSSVGDRLWQVGDLRQARQTGGGTQSVTPSLNLTHESLPTQPVPARGAFREPTLRCLRDAASLQTT